MKLYSHPRSGTNFARAFLSLAFTGQCKYKDVATGHWADRSRIQAPARELKGGHHFWNGHRGVYLVRDGRDVALSQFRTKGFQHPSWRGLSFGEFLRKPLDWYRTPGRKADPGITIVEHWKRHVSSWKDRDGVCYVRYEELLTEPQVVISRVATFWGREPMSREVTVGPVGPFPSEQHVVAKWRNTFTEEDLCYFFSVVDEDCWGLVA